MTGSTLNEVNLMRERMQYVAEENGVLTQVAQLLEMVAHNSVGLGEVLQDYAHQSYEQLHEITRIARRIAHGNCSVQDAEHLRNISLMLKTAQTVLQMTPTAMQRNKADCLGSRGLSRTDVANIAEKFNKDIHIKWLMQTEDAGSKLAATFAIEADAAIIPEYVQMLPGSAQHH